MLVKIGFIALIAGLTGLMFTLLERGVPNPLASRGGAPTHCTGGHGDCFVPVAVHVASVDRFFTTLASGR